MVMGVMHNHQLDASTKVYGSKNSSRIIWGDSGQKVIFTTNAISPSYYPLWLLDSLYKSYGSKNSSGVILGHGGQILIFTQNCFKMSEQHTTII